MDFAKFAEEFAALQAIPDDAQLQTEDASRALKLMGLDYTKGTLEKLRCVSTGGPPYQKIGRSVVYRLGDLRAFAGMQSRAA